MRRNRKQWAYTGLMIAISLVTLVLSVGLLIDSSFVSIGAVTLASCTTSGLLVIGWCTGLLGTRAEGRSTTPPS